MRSSRGAQARSARRPRRSHYLLNEGRTAVSQDVIPKVKALGLLLRGRIVKCRQPCHERIPYCVRPYGDRPSNASGPSDNVFPSAAMDLAVRCQSRRRLDDVKASAIASVYDRRSSPVDQRTISARSHLPTPVRLIAKLAAALGQLHVSRFSVV